VVQLEKYFDFSLYSHHFSLLSLTSLLSAHEREVTSPSDFKVVGALLPYYNGIPTLPYYNEIPTLPYYNGIPTLPYYNGIPTLPYYNGIPTLPYYFEISIGITEISK
jgi:hypothetical protein